MNTSYVVVLGLAEKRIGLVVGHLIGQEEVVIKSLVNSSGRRRNCRRNHSGDGRVRLIVDPAGIFTMMSQQI